MSRTSTVLHVDTLSIEGGLFTSEWLAKVSAQQAAMQADADYGVRAGFNLREEIGFAWRSAQTLWRQFDQARQQPNSDAWGISQHFATELLRQCFAFSLTKQALPIVIAERNYPVQFSALEGHIPIVISPHDEVKALDVAHYRLGDNSGERVRKRSAFGLLQESLNAMPDALWGIATNGLQLRIARDNASLTRPAWVEVDLERLFAEERYADFSVMWLLLHASRFGSAGSSATDCALEQWRNACREQGTRARETLRGGVEAALLELGQGFVSHPANTVLRDALATGTLSSHEYLRELLRLVYRQIFLLTVEDREILHRSDADPGAVALYADGYSLRRLRERAVRRSAHDRHGDLWQALKQAWIGLGVGEPLLALPPLGGLFESNQCPSLDACKLENRFLLSALFHLAWLRPEANAPLTRVNWRDMGPEELGSIYESLLELVPMLSNGHRQFGFQTGAATRGNARKTSGSYYTHDSLVQVQLESALEPVIASTLESHPVGQDAVDALLELSVIDPACGSGHFLLAAARRIAGHLARVRAQMRDSELGNSGQPTPEDYRHALRDVVTHCVYGVDMNPMALELARMALWLEGYTPDAPLGFIDHHFLLGNGLLGLMDPKMILDGVPDMAFTALTGDDAALCRDLKRRNRTERTGLLRMREAASFSQSLQSMDLSATALPLQQLEVLPDETLAEIAAKRQAYERLQLDAGTDGLSLALNLYCASYLLPKHGTETDTDVPTTQDVMNALLGQTVSERKKQAAFNLAKRVPLLHWRLGFAQVFARGGFSVILANPPWERMKLQEEEYFAERAPAVAEARNKAERERAIRALGLSTPGSPERRIYDDFNAAKQIAEAGSVFCHGPRYPLTGTGDVNTYALFAETALQILHPLGRAGLVLPSGIATDGSTSAFFGEISKGRIVQLVDFENREGLFAGVHRSYKFCLLTVGENDSALFAFFLGNTEQLKDARRTFTLTATEISKLNPNSRTCPVFRSKKDAEITTEIYDRVPIFWDENNANGNVWNVKFMTMFHMASDSELFIDYQNRSKENLKNEIRELLPLYEAKLIHQFDHRWATYSSDSNDARDMTDFEKSDLVKFVQPRYWIEKSIVDEMFSEKKWIHDWILGFRDITNTTNERTVIASIFPKAGAGNTLPIILVNENNFQGKNNSVLSCSLLLANLCSLVLDYVARVKLGGIHLTYNYLKQFAIIPPDSYDDRLLGLIIPRVLELTYTSEDLSNFYKDVVAINSNFDVRNSVERGRAWQWNPERRAILRSELDAIYARLYGLTRDDLRYILDPSDIMGDDYPSETFRGLKAKEIRHLGEYRTRRLVLEAWDKLEQGEL
jgi:hypothetical protein